MKLSSLVPAYTASKQALDADDPYSLERVAGHVLNGAYSENLFTEHRNQHKINKEAPFEPQHEAGPQLDAFFASMRFLLVGTTSSTELLRNSLRQGLSRARHDGLH